MQKVIKQSSKPAADSSLVVVNVCQAQFQYSKYMSNFNWLFLGSCTVMLMWGVGDENYNICFMEKAGCVLPLTQRHASEHVLYYNNIMHTFISFQNWTFYQKKKCIIFFHITLSEHPYFSLCIVWSFSDFFFFSMTFFNSPFNSLCLLIC